MKSNRHNTLFAVLACMFVILPLAISCKSAKADPAPVAPELIALPKPSTRGNVSIEETLASRRSIRSYADRPLSLQVLSQILWSAQGISESSKKYRTAPSAGATFPLELYILIDKVDTLQPGIYQYQPLEHSIKLIHRGDFKTPIREKAARQGSISQAPFTLIFCADYDKIRPRYRERSERYVFMEIGHAAQNVHLQCEALNLGTVCIGAFDDEALPKVLKLPEANVPYYMMPVGSK